MNTSTDSYHNLLIQGGPTRDDLPSTPAEALDEWEGNIISVCEDCGIRYNAMMTLDELILAWMRTDVGQSIIVSEVGWEVKSTVISRGDLIPYMNGLNDLCLESIGVQSTRRGRAPVISIVYNDNN